MISMWEQIRMNRRRSVVLVVLMAILLMALGYAIAEGYQPGAGPFGLLIATAVWLVMSLVAYFQGDNILLAVSGAKEIEKKDHPRLFNVIEEMQIASGLPKMPRVFIMDDMALNAFAAGRRPDKAVVAVTAGLLGKLNRDQLQGVVAHEMSHIVNRDVLLMTIVGVTIGSIVLISELFLRGFRFGGRGAHSRRYQSSRGGNGAGGIMIIVAIVLAILAPIVAQFIYLAISRRREYLADASAAVLTRYPEGLAGALQLIGTDPTPMARATKATAPMYISNPFEKPGAMALRLTSTHPPIQQRIKILRGMAGAASFQEYDDSLKTVRGRKSGVVPLSALQADQAIPIRPPSTDDAPDDPRLRMREAGDMVRQMNKFAFIACPCGIKIKIPPDYNRPVATCPRCQTKHPIPTAKGRL